MIETTILFIEIIIVIVKFTQRKMTREVLTKKEAILEFHRLKSGFSNLDLLKIPSYFRMLRHEKFIRHESKIVINSFFPPFPSKAFEGVFNRGTGYPMSTNIAVTSKCHGKCGYCSYNVKQSAKQSDARNNAEKSGFEKSEQEKKEIKNDIELSKLINIISQVQSLKVPMIGFTGGESLLREDLEEIITSIDERSSTILYTSGLGLTEQRARKLKQAGLFFSSISLDHYDKNINDRLRFAGSYETAVNAIRNSLEAGLYTVSSIVVTNETVNDLEKYIKFCNELSVHGIRVLDVIPSGECIKKPPVSIETRKKLVRMHKKINANLNLPQLTASSYFEDSSMFGCGAGGIHHMYIDGDGNLRACDFIPITFGDLTKEPLSEAYKRMREFFEYPEEECFMKRYYFIINKALNGRRLVHYDEVASLIRETRTGTLPKLYKF